MDWGTAQINGFEEIPWLKGRYAINKGTGQVYSIRRGALRKVIYYNYNGYIRPTLPYTTCLNGNKEQHSEAISRIIAKMFILNPDNKPQVNHKDGNPQNNTVENLEWATCQENITHAYKTGLVNKNKNILRAITNYKKGLFPSHLKSIERKKAWYAELFYLLSKGLSMARVGKEVGVTREWVRRIVNKFAKA